MTQNATWSFTIPHSSPIILYNDFWWSCPFEDEVMNCGDETSYHYSNPEESVSFDVPFSGSAIYIYGSVDDGVTYTTQIPGLTGVVAGKPEGTLLAKHEGLTGLVSTVDTLSHTLTLATMRTTNRPASLSITHIEVHVDAQSAGEPVVEEIQMNDDRVRLSSGWTKDGSYWRAGTSADQTVTLNFNGNGILVYGVCGNTFEEFATRLGGTPRVDGIERNSLTTDTDVEPYRIDDCLITYDPWLKSGKHNFTWSSQRNPIMLSRFEVVTFPPPGSTSPSSSASSISTSTTKSPTDPAALPPPEVPSGGSSIKTAAIVGAVIGLVVVLLAALGFFLIRRRKDKRTRAASQTEKESSPTPGTKPMLESPSFTTKSPIATESLPALLSTEPPAATGGYYSTYDPSSGLLAVGLTTAGTTDSGDVKRASDFDDSSFASVTRSPVAEPLSATRAGAAASNPSASAGGYGSSRSRGTGSDASSRYGALPPGAAPVAGRHVLSAEGYGAEGGYISRS